MTVLETITNYAVSEEASSTAFSELRDIAITFTFGHSKDFIDHLKIGENEYMEMFHSDNQDAKKRNGEWKYATYLPKAYSSAKSVLSRAIESDIDFSSLGKSAIEKELRGLKTKVEVSVDDRARSYVTKLQNAWGEVGPNTRRDIVDILNHLIDMA